jgi:copper(I)-binding protein
VPAGGSIAFTPGSYHLMCMDPKAAMKPGGSVPVTLQFQDGGRLTANFAVRNAAGK